MSKLKNTALIIALLFTVGCSAMFLVDMFQRHEGNLRAKTSVAAHEMVKPAFTHDLTGKPRYSFKILEPVFTHEHYKKLQSCHSTISNIFVNTKTNYIYRGESYYTWVKQGEYDISEGVDLPPSMTPGSYRFVRKTVSFCGGDQVYYTTNFDLQFEIVGP